jgi:hypothetical protein
MSGGVINTGRRTVAPSIAQFLLPVAKIIFRRPWEKPKKFDEYCVEIVPGNARYLERGKNIARENRRPSLLQQAREIYFELFCIGPAK